MDIGFNQNYWRPAPAARDLPGCRSDAPEWQALHARLCATWLAGRELTAAGGGDAANRGSFEPGGARAIAAFELFSQVVNPTALGNGKPADAIACSDGGDAMTGGRG